MNIRRARHDDLPAIIDMLADDPLGSTRERPNQDAENLYAAAFDAIGDDANNELLVAELGLATIAVAQLTFVPSLTYTGGWRAQIEGVRVHEDHRGGGVGERLFEHLISLARERNCVMVQLTTDRRRPEALRFYERLGFVHSHAGMKLHLQSPSNQTR